MKVSPSPGVCARPLTAFELIREKYRDIRWDRIYFWWKVRCGLYPFLHPIAYRRLQMLSKALAIPSRSRPGVTLQVESLEATMRKVRYVGPP